MISPPLVTPTAALRMYTQDLESPPQRVCPLSLPARSGPTLTSSHQGPPSSTACKRRDRGSAGWVGWLKGTRLASGSSIAQAPAPMSACHLPSSSAAQRDHLCCVSPCWVSRVAVHGVRHGGNQARDHMYGASGCQLMKAEADFSSAALFFCFMYFFLARAG